MKGLQFRRGFAFYIYNIASEITKENDDKLCKAQLKNKTFIEILVSKPSVVVLALKWSINNCSFISTNGDTTWFKN